MSVQFEGISVSYRSRGVLDDLSWRVDEGITGLLGPNGAGKTTLINVAVGLSKPGKGEVIFSDFPVRLGYVPQRFSLAGEMTVRDTLAYAAWVNGVPSDHCGLAADRVIDLVQLAEQRLDRVRGLSGGQRQRVGVAAALAHDPNVVILDEPTVGLDPGQRLRLREVIARIAEDRVVLLSTHLVEDVVHLCQRVGVLASGRIRFSGTPQELEERMESAGTGDSVHGSSFERAYNALISDLGADVD